MKKRVANQKEIKQFTFKAHNLELRSRGATVHDDIVTNWSALSYRDIQEFYRRGQEMFYEGLPLKQKKASTAVRVIQATSLEKSFTDEMQK